MMFPVQVAPIRRDSFVGPYTESRHELRSGLLPSCDPTTQITCGSGCCNANLEYCLGNRCHPYE
jgi:hypothetical protein